MIDSIAAFNAYKNQMKLQETATEDSSSGSGATGPSFSDFLGQQLNSFVDTQKTAEAAQVAAVTGTGDITDLVTAIANAEMALNTIVTIRDKAITAYQDIIRMPI